jgi:hypothetical protein
MCVGCFTLCVLSPDLKYSHQFCVSVLVWSGDFVSPLPIFLGWFSCSLQGALHWPVHFPRGVLARSSHCSSSGVRLPGSEIFGFSLLSEVRCQDFVLCSVHLVLANFLRRSVSLLPGRRSDPEEFPSHEPARRPIYALSTAG